LLDSNEQLQAASYSAEKAIRAKSWFLANMSHELRTPLNAILGFSGLMRDEAGISEEQRKTLDIINRSGEHLLNLLNDVLDVARIEAGSVSVEISSVDMMEMLSDITNLMRLRAKEKDLELLQDTSSEFPRLVLTDGHKLRQVLINLVGNAIKYTQKGSVTLRLDSRPGETAKRVVLILEVEDTGVGISVEDQSRIFDPFVQVGNLVAQKGTGLGLAITRTYVEMMGGRVSVESTLGKGSIFRVEAPVDLAEESEVIKNEITCGRIVGLVPDQPEHRILIVEDQMDSLLLLKRLMENVGFETRVAMDGGEGVKMFQSWRPHFIWMDVRMPIMDGLEATRRIRTLDGGQDVKIVALTASVFKEERDNVIEAGMDDFVRKPYRPVEIFDCMKRQLGVSFVYEQASDTSVSEPTTALIPEVLVTLPSELRVELIDALVSLDATRIAELIGRVSVLNPSLGNTLAHHAGQLGYTSILRALQAGIGRSNKETT